jgi:hypothetical protein
VKAGRTPAAVGQRGTEPSGFRPPPAPAAAANPAASAALPPSAAAAARYDLLCGQVIHTLGVCVNKSSLLVNQVPAGN